MIRRQALGKRTAFRLRVLAVVVALLASTFHFALASRPAKAIENGVYVHQNNTPPWIAYIEDTSLITEGKCTGTVISEWWVLTAAHCIKSENTDYTVHYSALNIIIGRADLEDGQQHGFESRIASAPVLHSSYEPNYNQNSPKIDDVALLRLQTRYTGTPAPLLVDGNAIEGLVDQHAKLYGYGDVAAPAFGGIRQHSYELRSTTDSAYIMRKSTPQDETYDCHYNLAHHCFERVNDSVNVRTGDSGAPWLVNYNGALAQISVHSSSNSTHEMSWASSVSKNLDWITGVVGGVHHLNIVAPPAPPPPAPTYFGPGSIIRHSTGAMAFIADNKQAYYIPSGEIVNCLAAPIVQLTNDTHWTYYPFNIEGDPSGRWATCSTKYLGRLIRHPTGAIAYVSFEGFSYHVPNGDVVNCLGGNVISVNGPTWAFIPANPYGAHASCNTKLRQRLVRHPSGAIGFIASNGYRYHVGGEFVNCLGGEKSIVPVSDSTWHAVPQNFFHASCNTRFINRLVRRANGVVNYFAGNNVSYWVPGELLNCLGGWESTIFLSDGRFDSLGYGGTASCNHKHIVR